MAGNNEAGKLPGRLVLINIGDSAVSEVFITLGVALNSKSLSWATEQLDVTNDAGGRFRAAISGGKVSISISIGGVQDLNAAAFELLRDYNTAGSLFNVQWEEPTVGNDGQALANAKKYQVCVQITAFDPDAPTDGTYDWSASLESAGEVTEV